MAMETLGKLKTLDTNKALSVSATARSLLEFYLRAFTHVLHTESSSSQGKLVGRIRHYSSSADEETYIAVIISRRRFH